MKQEHKTAIKEEVQGFVSINISHGNVYKKYRKYLGGINHNGNQWEEIPQEH